MQNSSVLRLCVQCKSPLNHNQPFCSICGTKQPQLAMPVQKKNGLSAWSITTLIFVGAIGASCGLCGLFGAIVKQDEKQQASIINTSSTPSVTPASKPTLAVTTSSAPKPIGSSDERLQVAADVRRYLQDQDIPAKVVASGTKISVLYTSARAEYNPQETFLKQQRKQGLQKMANAGFETLEIEVYDSDNQLQRHTVSLIEYRNRK